MNMSQMKITKANTLIEASYALELAEQRIVLACIAQIDSRKEVPPEITLHAADYAKEFDIELKHAYSQLSQAVKSLYERSIKINDSINKKRHKFRWVSAVTYHDGEGKVTLCFNEKIRPYLGNLKERYTSYRLGQVSKLKSTYSIKLFELLMQFKSTSNRTVSVEQFRDFFALTERYTEFKELNKYVIKPAVAELQAKASLNIKVEYKKVGTKITTLVFKFKETEQQYDFLEKAYVDRKKVKVTSDKISKTDKNTDIDFEIPFST